MPKASRILLGLSVGLAITRNAPAAEPSGGSVADFVSAILDALQVASETFPSAARRCHGNEQCGPHRYCAKPPGDCDGVGQCRRRPQVCPENYDPVCGCDGNTYSNACFAAMAGVSIAHPGECPEICGGISGIPCDDPDEFCKLPTGHCCCDFQGVCTPIPQGCPDVYDPVCGCDGITYGNECEAEMAGISVDHEGECEQICGGITGIPCDDGEFCRLPDGDCCCDFQGVCAPIPQACPDNIDPVCGCDGVTYFNRCEADMAGVSVDHVGACEQVCGGFAGIPCPDGQFCLLPDGQCCCDFQGVCHVIPDACPAIYDPVCGCDGVTYGNRCEAARAGVSVDYEGPCRSG